MARIYLEPGDVGAADARMVLDFLNAATSAEEIAAAVELPNELDIGVRLAQRLLDRRAQLGSFTTLQQVADVPLIGPERFTEIVTTLSAARLPQGDVPANIGDELRALRRDLDALRGAAAAQPSLTLETLQAEPYLGQSVNVVARATAPGGEQPLIGATVVVATTWGRLRGVEGVQLRDAQSLRLRTGVDGAARAILLPPTSEDLTGVQQSTLEVALQGLDPAAMTPVGTQAGLQALAERYRRGGDAPFRRAVDIYFRDFAGRASEPLNVRDALAAWAYFQGTLVAYLPSAEVESSVQATAVRPLWVRDWLAPWLEVLQSLAHEAAGLDTELVDLVRTHIADEGAGTVLSRVYGRIHDFVDDQAGVVGQFVGRKVAERSLTTVLDAGLADATREQRVALFPGAEAGTRLLDTAPTSVLAGIGDARADLRRDIQPRIDAGIAGVQSSISSVQSQLTDRVAAIETSVSAKADASRVAALESADQARAATIATITSQIGDIQTALGGKIDASQFEAFQSSTQDQFASLQQTTSQLDTTVGTLNTSLSGLNTNVTDLRRSIGQ